MSDQPQTAQWQPIKFAHKDGQAYLLTDKQQTIVGMWVNSERISDGAWCLALMTREGVYEPFEDGHRGFWAIDATHYQPIPELPA